MKYPRVEKLREELKFMDRHSTDEILQEVLEELEKLPAREPEPYDFVRVNMGQGEVEYGMVVSYNPDSRTASVALPNWEKYSVALGDIALATPEEARGYAAARASAPKA